MGGTYCTLDALTLSGNSISGVGTTAVDIDDTQRSKIGSLSMT